MSHFAEVIDGIVTRVIVADQEFIDTLDNSTQWIQTSYNTHGGINKRTDIPIRKNFAGVDMTYDKDRDAFIGHNQYPSWTLNEESCLYEPPTPYPNDDKLYSWNEDSQEWIELKMP